MGILQVGIIGAETMGGGIAQVVAQAGFQVALLDLSEALVRGRVEKIEENLSRSDEKMKLFSRKRRLFLKESSPRFRLRT
jgi:3-hydroxybutyryl-CoA dehydrogenase